jgi:predicted  nucleic acid-binding Zn-ribbon protein
MSAPENAERNALAAERAETSLSTEKRENDILRQKLVDMTMSYEEKQVGYLEAKKIADSLMQDTDDFRASAETAQGEVVDLRNALNQTRLINTQMKNEMVTLHEDIQTFKTQYEYNMLAREDEITSQQAQIDQLQKQLDIKDEIVRNAARDVTELRKIRTAQDLERERLENVIETQTYQLDQAQSDVVKSQQDASDFDRRCRRRLCWR